MPIKGMTDKNAKAGFPALGKLRKGAEKPNDKQPGPELPYFRFTSPDPKVAATFLDKYGEKPSELEVFLPFPALEDNFPTCMERWVFGGLHHRCDGEICSSWLSSDGKYHSVEQGAKPIPCPGGCKQVGRLIVLLQPLLEARHVGYVVMETHAKHDILSIWGSLLETARLKRTEDLRGQAFLLRRVYAPVSTPLESGKRTITYHWLVQLVPMAQWFERQLESAGVVLALPDGNYVDVDPETGEILSEDEDEDENENEDEDSLDAVFTEDPPADPLAIAEGDEVGQKYLAYVTKAAEYYSSQRQVALAPVDILVELGYATLQALVDVRPGFPPLTRMLKAKYGPIRAKQAASESGEEAAAAASGPGVEEAAASASGPGVEELPY